MAEVWRAWDERLGRPVAVKLLHPQALPPDRERFLLEARALARLHHPGIVQVLDLGEEEGRPYIVMELLEGGSFDRLGPFEEGPEGEGILLAAERVLEALHYLHTQGVLHRDLTPKNILLTPEGYPKVMDFGLAYILQESRHLTRTGYTLGTPLYMAPEQAKGLPLTPKADLYSFGAVLYRTLTGRPPFEGENDQAILFKHVYEEPIPPQDLNPAIPKGVGERVLALLAKHPEERPEGVGLWAGAVWSLRTQALATPRGGQARAGHYPLAPEPRRLRLLERWELGTEVAWPTEMVYAEGWVYLGSAEGVWALELGTGQRELLRLPGGVLAPPLYRGGRLWVGDGEGGVHRIRGLRSEGRWATGAEITAGALALGDRVYFPSRDGALYALKGEAFRLLFRAEGHLSASPTLYRGLLFLPSEGGWVYALDPKEGRLLYKVRTGPVHTPVAGGGGRVYLVTWSGEVYAFDPLARETLWSLDLEAEVWAPLALDRDRVYLAAWDGVLRALEGATGAEVFSLEVGRVTGGLVLAGGHLYLGTEEGRFLVVDRRGQPVFEATGLGPIQVPPLPLAEEVLVVNTRGSLYRFGVG